MNKVDHIKALRAAGYTLIPLNGKKPFQDDWPQFPFEAYDERNLKDCNYGVALKAEDLIIDVDPRNFERGDRPLQRLIKDLDISIDTFVVRSGSGGLHVYLKMPPAKVRKNLREYRGLDFLSAGRQVVGPGSVHPDTGQEYVVAAGSPAGVGRAPAVLTEKIRRRPIDFGPGTGEYKEDTQTYARYLAFLRNTPGAVQGRGGDDATYKVVLRGRDFALAPAAVYDLLLSDWNEKCSPPWSEEDLKTKVRNAYTYARGAVGSAHPEAQFSEIEAETKEEPPKDAAGRSAEEIDWVMNKGGGVVKCFQNLLTYMRLPDLRGVVGYNEFSGRPEFLRPAPWHRGKLPWKAAVRDADLKQLKGFLAVKYGFEMPTQNIEEALTITARDNRFHPVRDYLNGLKWDGVPRIDKWLVEHLDAEDTDYVRACGRKALCAAVRRIYKPGCKFDHVLILEGEQGVGKSTVCRILGDPWYADFPMDPHKADTIQAIQGKWVIELSELEVTRRADMDALKAFISRQEDVARFAYGRYQNEIPRQSILIATKNPGLDGTYLKDETGNRRWWPVLCHTDGVDFKKMAAARDQLFAEAVAAVKGKKEKLFMETAELRREAAGEAKLRLMDHPWVERIGAWIDGLKEKDALGVFLTANRIFADALGGVDRLMDRKETVKIAGCMRSLGWEPCTDRINGRVIRGYRPCGFRKREKTRRLESEVEEQLKGVW